MSRFLEVDVRGMPRPQGSINAFPRRNGAGQMVGVGVKYAPTVYAWRAQVQQAMTEALPHHSPWSRGAVELHLGFDLPRPTGHLLPVNSKRSAPEVSKSAPARPIVAPDLDKLVRAVMDACTDAGVWKDDAQVCVIVTAKRYVTTQPGVRISVVALDEEEA